MDLVKTKMKDKVIDNFKKVKQVPPFIVDNFKDLLSESSDQDNFKDF